MFNIFKKKEIKSEWDFDKSLLDHKIREEGVSGFMRLRNEEDYLALTIETHIPFLDELVIVYNRCTDRTPQIAEEFRKKYPDKIKVYHYEPIVYSQGSKEHKQLPPNSHNSLVNYYNYALSKTTKKIAVKIDGDHVVIPDKFKLAIEEFRSLNKKKFLTFSGINLWDAQQEIWINGNRPLTGGGDIGFFYVTKKTYFIHGETFELFRHGYKIKHFGPIFYHLKSMKKDRGIGNYDLEENPDSKYFYYIGIFYDKPKLLDVKKYLEENSFSDIPLPHELGIKQVVLR